MQPEPYPELPMLCCGMPHHLLGQVQNAEAEGDEGSLEILAAGAAGAMWGVAVKPEPGEL